MSCLPLLVRFGDMLILEQICLRPLFDMILGPRGKFHICFLKHCFFYWNLLKHYHTIWLGEYEWNAMNKVIFSFHLFII
uniref:Uncharacterized protein n=1 Tax=Cannabis sativa TaxID=3483 RepID=A0A803R097_CANSA